MPILLTSAALLASASAPITPLPQAQVASLQLVSASAELQEAHDPAAIDETAPAVVDGVQPEAPPQDEGQEEAEPAVLDTAAEDEPGTGAADEENVIIVTADGQAPLKDPLEKVNVAAYKVIQEVDTILIAPIADAYEEGLPGPLRKGLRNFFRNLMEPVNALNYLLQLKPGKAFETLGRFTLNTTVGVGGLLDVAKNKPFNLPYRRNGLANTLGYYGVGTGPFLVLPLVGATTVRDLLGGLLDQSFLPTVVGKPFDSLKYAIPAFTVNSLEYRIEFDERLEQISTSDDPYYAMRESYLCLREADIAALKNRPPPRDCSIAAIMAGPEPVAPSAAAPPSIEAPAVPSEAVETLAPDEPAPPPEIIYVSEEVVQPLPAV